MMIDLSFLLSSPPSIFPLCSPSPLFFCLCCTSPLLFLNSTMTWAMEASHPGTSRQLTRASGGASPAVVVAGSLHVTKLK